MSIIASIFTGPILSALTGGLFDKLEKGWELYVNKQITKDQLLAEIQRALIDGLREVEAALLDSMAKTYGSFMQAMVQSPAMQRAWSVVLYSQVFVLLWHQLAIPAIATWGIDYKSSGTTVDWAYALVALCLGVPQIAARVGPVASWATDSLKRLISK